MEKIGASSIWSFLDGMSGYQKVTNQRIRSDIGFQVSNYIELAAKVAELQFRNRSYVLLFRGQSGDYKTSKGLTSLKPSIFRTISPGRPLSKTLVQHRYKCLEIAENKLAERFESLARLGRQRIQRQRLLRWSILQHYEVCSTPVLDVSQSLRVAASFASDRISDESFVFVLGVPNISGAVTASAEAGIQVVRLSSVCPPSALRPHIQEGYLIGQYPDIATPDQKQHYKPYQLDFGLRLIGKFRFNSQSFWEDSPMFPQVRHEALYPASKDWLETAAKDIRAELASVSNN